MRPILPALAAALMLAACQDNADHAPGQGTVANPPAQGTTPGDPRTPQPGSTSAGSTSTGSAPAGSAPADNSARNARDDGSKLTPIDQGENPQALAITQAVRKALVADPNLGTNAKNIKIIANNQVVTLRGPVANASERDHIVELVKAVPGVEHITNELEVLQDK
jgi:osmotically-inducible protein OsmY